MNNLALTILAATILMGLAVAGLSIGLILTGKSHLRRGCGWTPTKDKPPTCPLCGKKKEGEEDNETDC